MCRMVAVRAEDAMVRTRILSSFRSQAHHGHTGPDDHRTHVDGWGIAGLTPSGLLHFGRSLKDAAEDAAFLAAVRDAASAEPRSVTLAHVRNASIGATRVENSHPFIRAGWAFCHNGTIRDLETPTGWTAEGDTDSERFFLQILAARARTESMEAAIRSVVGQVLKAHPYSSLTFFLTDGHELYAFRKVGPDPGACGTRECALEHYMLGTGRYDGALVVLQEPQFLAGLQEWSEIPDGALLHVDRSGRTRLIEVLREASSALQTP